MKATTAVVQQGINQGKSLQQMKDEKIPALWHYLETPPIKTDIYLERLYKSVTSKSTGSTSGGDQ